MTALSIFRVACLSIYAYSIYFWQNIPPSPNHPMNSPPLGNFKFLTFWDLLLQTLFAALLVLGSGLIKSKTLSKFTDFFFYSLALPVSLYVAVSFWAVYAIDRELIFPRAIEKIYPGWLNHSTHTLVAILPLVELVFGRHAPPGPRSRAFTVLHAFMTTYFALTLYLALAQDYWVYGFMKVLNWPQRIGFSLLTVLVVSGFYSVGVVGSRLAGKLVGSGSSSGSSSAHTGPQKRSSNKYKKH